MLLRRKMLLRLLLGGQGAAAPVNLSIPSLSGENPPLSPGETLIIDVGTWSNTPTSFTVDLYDDTYALIAADVGTTPTILEAWVGETLHCVVTAHNAGGSSGPVSSLVAADPVISSTTQTIGVAVVGDDGTFDGLPGAVTYQWQYYDGAAWQNITGATSKNYTPVDTDWGYTLRLARVPTIGDPLYSNATGAVIEVPAQSYGSTLLTNGNMETGDPPSNWTATGSTLSSVADERTGGAGSASMNMAAASGTQRATQNGAINSGEWMELDLWLRNVDATSAQYNIRSTAAARWLNTSAEIAYTGTDWRHDKGLTFARNSSGASVWLHIATNGASNVRFDDVILRKLTYNPVLVPPSADGQFDLVVTLPETPAVFEKVMFLARVSAMATGDFLSFELMWDASQWNTQLYAVIAGARTAVGNAGSNVGNVNKLRFNLNGNQIRCYTSTDGGDNWTQRGGNITNTNFQASKGVTVITTSDIVLGNLTRAAAA